MPDVAVIMTRTTGRPMQILLDKAYETKKKEGQLLSGGFCFCLFFFSNIPVSPCSQFCFIESSSSFIHT